MPKAKLHRCVSKVKQKVSPTKGRTAEQSAYAICQSSQKKGKKAKKKK